MILTSSEGSRGCMSRLLRVLSPILSKMLSVSSSARSAVRLAGRSAPPIALKQVTLRSPNKKFRSKQNQTKIKNKETKIFLAQIHKTAKICIVKISYLNVW